VPSFFETELKTRGAPPGEPSFTLYQSHSWISSWRTHLLDKQLKQGEYGITGPQTPSRRGPCRAVDTLPDRSTEGRSRHCLN
jgi:hypothetical protein